MRNLKELLEIVLRQFIAGPDLEVDRYLKSEYWNLSTFRWNGICQVIFMLAKSGVITLKEQKLLEEYINMNKPDETYGVTNYWWRIKDYEPRIKWLRKQIDSLKS